MANNYHPIDYCGSPSYEPNIWDLQKDIHETTNCYSYAFNRIEMNRENKLQPGMLSNNEFKIYECNALINHISEDHPNIKKVNGIHEPVPCNHYKIALVLDNKGEKKDYHFYRQDKDGYWSHKTGKNPITNVDASGNKITDPELCDRNYDKEEDDEYNYEIFCGYFSVPYNEGPMKIE
jgi:hypothetical protein